MNTADVRYALALTAALTLCSCGADPTGPSTPEPPPLGTLVFVSAPDSDNTGAEWQNLHIERIRTDGSHRAPVTDYVGNISIPLSLSPDRSEVLFTTWAADELASQGRIRRLHLDTGGIEDVPWEGGAWSASWSPDGSHIAFLTPRGIQFDVAEMRADGTEFQFLTDDQDGKDGVAWSPGGDLILYVNSHANSNYDQDLWTVPLSGATPMRLFRLPDSFDDSYPTRCYDPRWSPDGSAIVFMGTTGRTAGIHTIEADGSRLQRITSEGAKPCWSPDGEWIVFSKLVWYDDGADSSYELFAVRRNGTQLQGLTSTRDVDELGAVWME